MSGRYPETILGAVGGVAGARDRARLAAAMVEHQLRRDGEAFVEEGGIDAAFEALARIGGEGELLPVRAMRSGVK